MPGKYESKAAWWSLLLLCISVENCSKLFILIRVDIKLRINGRIKTRWVAGMTVICKIITSCGKIYEGTIIIDIEDN